MKFRRMIFQNFEYIWNTYCSEQKTGYKILGKNDFSSESFVPILWSYDLKTGIKILIIIFPGKTNAIPNVLVDVDEEKRESIIVKHKFPKYLRNKYKIIGNFCFQKNELSTTSFTEESWDVCLSNKSENIDPNNFSKILKSINERRTGGGSKQLPHSVHTISGGLYGLGKSRKH